MPVFHIIETAYPAIAVRTTRNRRSAEMLLSYFGEGFEITEDVCGDSRTPGYCIYRLKELI
jgi:hypothetical protein